MVDPGDVIELSNQMMDALLEGWSDAVGKRPEPLPGILPGQLRKAEDIEPAVAQVLEEAPPEVVEELERWWLEVDHYSPLVAQEYGGCQSELTDLLQRKDHRYQEHLVVKDPVLQSWGLTVRLLKASKELWREDPHRAADLAQLAVRVTQVLDPDWYEPRWVSDLAARCWAYLGNGRQILGELRSAQEAFEASKRFLATGTGRLLPRARVASLEASLLVAQRNFPRAKSLLGMAARFYRELGLGHEEGRVLLKLAKLAFERGEPLTALEALESGLKRIDPAQERDLHFIASNNLALCLLESGRVSEAAQVMASLKPSGSLSLLLRGLWTKGLILTAQGELTEAGYMLHQVREVYLKKDLGYDAALVSLDLSAVYLQQGESGKVRELAEEIYPLFMAQGVEREALAALLVFRRAAQEDAVTLELVRSLSKVLQRIRK